MEVELQPTVFYRRQKECFENGAAAFRPQAATTIRPKRNALGLEKIHARVKSCRS
jgi:hypothetical protein